MVLGKQEGKTISQVSPPEIGETKRSRIYYEKRFVG